MKHKIGKLKYWVIGSLITTLAITILLNVMSISLIREKKRGMLRVLYKNYKPKKNANNIYITETSMDPIIHSRYLCGVESYCKLNPDGHVFLLVFVDHLSETVTRAVQKLHTVYKNLIVLQVDVHFAFENTPFASLLKTEGFLINDNKVKENLKDMLRLAILYKSGGFYADTDIIAVKNITKMRNFLVMKEGNHIASASFHFDSGHPFIKMITQEYMSMFKVDQYGTGVYPYTPALEKYCPLYNKSKPKTGFDLKSSESEKCPEVPFSHPQPVVPCNGTSASEPNAHYMIHWSRLDRLFRMTEEELCMKSLMKRGLGVHWGNSVAHFFIANPDSAIETLAKRSCPIVYNWNGTKGVFSTVTKFN